MLRNKKGQELSMTMIVVIILAILVLAVVALIFLGGTSGAVQNLRDIFVPQSGTALNLAIEQCEAWCDQASSSNNPKLTAYCTRTQHVDKSPQDGKADRDGVGELINYYCGKTSTDNPDNLGVLCPEVVNC